MKEIYMISLDDDVPLQSETSSDIKAIACFVFDELDRYEKHLLCLNEDPKLLKNDLYEIYNPYEKAYKYVVTSDKKNIDYRNYEPFIINNTSFGFTAYANSVSEKEIRDALRNALFFLNLYQKNYHFNIRSLKYDEDRLNTINLLASNSSKKNSKAKVKKRIKQPILAVFGLR